MTATATEIRERPIIFSGPMVNAILAGQKTQTRRVIKPQPWRDVVAVRDVAPAGHKMEPGDWCSWTAKGDISGHVNFWWHCPYGVAGDLLWVREKVKYQDTFHRPTGLHSHHFIARVEYADGTVDKPVVHMKHWTTACEHKTDQWRPSIHMPRWASRLTLEITDVRVERLKDISETDAIAEGAQCPGVPASLSNVGAFAKLWESIHGKGSWDASPWVWVVEFKQVEA